MKLETRWQDWANVVFGIWLILAPFILGYAGTETAAAVHSYILGVAVAVFAFAALYRYQPWEEGINIVLGLWLIAAPFVLGFTSVVPALWNHIVVGLLIGGAALWVLLQKPQIHTHA